VLVWVCVLMCVCGLGVGVGCVHVRAFGKDVAC